MTLRALPMAGAEMCAYEAISISYQIESKIDVEELRRTGNLREEAIEPRWKDYDLSPEDRPTALSGRWDTSRWVVVEALDRDERLGGSIVARDTPALDMLEGRHDLALIFDIRVAPEFRGQGVGRALFNEAVRWARSQGCSELRVETQDVNVSACRFYSAMGCALLSVEENAYPGLDEAKLIWTLSLSS